MKKLVLIPLFSMLFLMISSCSKSDDAKTAETPTTSAKFIKLKCNGTQYDFANPEMLNSNARSLLGFTTNEKRITIFVPLNVTPGTYQITDSPSNVNAYQVSLAINALGFDGYATSGSMTITSVSGNNVKGTFACKIPNIGLVFDITEGSFDVGSL
jgi:hypothetical protein